VGSAVTYPTLTIIPLPTASSGSEMVTLNSTVQTGLAVKFASNSVVLTTDKKVSVGMTVNSSQSLTPGDYKITVAATYGTSSKTYDITIRVVQYLVLEQGNLFRSDTLTVKPGSTVYWINLDAAAGGDNEVHDVVFSSGSSVHSPDMTQYDTYSYTFATPGTYTYFCAYHPPGMKGTITVTA
jgi:plastocyanin